MMRTDSEQRPVCGLLERRLSLATWLWSAPLLPTAYGGACTLAMQDHQHDQGIQRSKTPGALRSLPGPPQEPLPRPGLQFSITTGSCISIEDLALHVRYGASMKLKR